MGLAETDLSIRNLDVETGRDGKSEKTTAMEKFYVDFAAQSKFRYMLIDAGWSKEGDITQMNGDVDVPAQRIDIAEHDLAS